MTVDRWLQIGGGLLIIVGWTTFHSPMTRRERWASVALWIGFAIYATTTVHIHAHMPEVVVKCGDGVTCTQTTTDSG